MIPTKGIWQNSPLSAQPNGFALLAENAVLDKGVYKNEEGCVEHSSSFASLNYLVIGKANLKYGDKLFFSIGAGGTNHIGIVKANGTYENKVSANLGFNQDYPIDVEVEYNFKGDVIAAFTDGLNTPKIINLNDIPAVIKSDSFDMFLGFKDAKIDTELIESGGSFQAGAHYPFIKYKRDDGSETPVSRIGNPVFTTTSIISQGYNKYTGVKAGSTTPNSIKLTLTEIDTSYDSILIGFVSKIDGVYTARIFKEEVITTPNLEVTVLGNEVVKDIDLKEVTTATVNYKTIKHLTKVNGVLYGAVVTEEPLLNFQKWALQIKLKFTSTLLTLTDINQSFKVHSNNSERRGFCHEEVYAFFIRLKIKGSGWTRAFPIPGRVADAEDIALNSSNVGSDASLTNDVSISATSKKFQTRDTTSPYSGRFGYWENQSEVYPDDVAYASFEITPGVFTEDLRGKKVRHHRFPSIRKMKETLYVNEAEYGKSKMDVLGVEIQSFPNLPSSISNLIEGYEICYAERSPINSTVCGQSLIQYGAKRQAQYNDSKVYTTSGNWGIQQSSFLSNVLKTTLYIDKKKLRFNSLDLLLNKPAINPTYLSNQLTFKKVNPMVEANLENQKWRWTHLFDYTSDNLVGTVPNEDAIRKINGFKYIPANTNTGEIVNYLGEETSVANIEGSELSFPPVGTANNFLFVSHDSKTHIFNTYEHTYLSNLMQFKTDMYSPLNSQKIVSTGKFILIGEDVEDNTIYGGDTFISDVSYVSSSPISSDGSPYTSEFNSKVLLAVVRRYMAETINNFSLRHEDEAVPESKYYPVTSLAFDNVWFKDWENTRARNRIVYNKDYTSINNINPIFTFNTKDQFTELDPYKIVRSKIPNIEEKSPSWRTFLANDYYIIQRDKGFITNIQGVGNELFINTEFSLLKTRSSDELATDTFKVILGTGNIFDRPPIEVVTDSDGYAGCQHKHSCLLTRFGYFFVDEDKKKVFLVNDTAKDISAGLENEFEKRLITSADNPYREKGYTVGWDEKYERIILSSVEADFTASFNPGLENWVSTHAYRPSVLIGDRNALYAIKGNKIFKHGVPSKRGVYYNEVIHPFTIALVFPTGEQSAVFSNVNWRTEFIIDEVQKENVTFDKALLWNSYQATGNLTLVPFNFEESLEDNFDKCNIRRIKKQWNLNRFRDWVKDREAKFIDDFIFLESNKKLNPNFEELRRMSDNFLVVKLLFSNKKFNTLQGEIKVLDVGVTANITNR